MNPAKLKAKAIQQRRVIKRYHARLAEQARQGLCPWGSIGRLILEEKIREFLKTHQRFWAVSFVLLVVSLITYSNSLHNEFVIDDLSRLIEDTSIRNIKQLYLNFSPAYMRLHHGDYYRPLLHALIMVNHALFGSNPVGYHLVNLFLLYISSILLYVLLNRIQGDWRISLLIGLLFITHPINGMLVNYKTATAFGVLIIFTLLSIITFLRYFEHAPQGKIYIPLSLFCFLIALLSHEIIVMFPLYLAAILYFIKKCSFKDIAKYCSPYVILLVVYFLFRFVFAGFTNSILGKIPTFGMSFLSYSATFTKLVLWYLSKLIFIKDIVLSWAAPIVTSGQMGWNMLLAVLIAGCSYVLFNGRKRAMGALAVSWMMIGFIPVTLGSLINPEFGLVIEPHWLFFSAIGFFIFIAFLLIDIDKKLPFHMAKVLMVLLLSVYVVSSRIHNYMWSSEKRYCQFWLKSFPHHSTGMFFLAKAYMGEGDLKDARALFKQLLTGRTTDWDIYLNLGLMDLSEGNISSAIQFFQRSAQLNPQGAVIYNNWASALMKIENSEGARQLLLKAVELNPLLIEPRLGLFEIYRDKGDLQSALEVLRENLKIDPHEENTLFGLVQVYGIMGKGDESVPFVTEILKISRNARQLTNTADVLAQGNHWDLALMLFDRALAVDPQYKETYLEKGKLFGNLNQFDRAIAIWQEGLKIDPADERFKALIARAQEFQRTQ